MLDVYGGKRLPKLWQKSSEAAILDSAHAKEKLPNTGSEVTEIT
jgi:hypothetical protein